jgi:hypothetical protein
VTIEGDSKLDVRGDVYQNIEGNVYQNVEGQMDAVVSGEVNLTSETDVNITAGGGNYEDTYEDGAKSAKDVKGGVYTAQEIHNEWNDARFLPLDSHMISKSSRKPSAQSLTATFQ